MFFINKYYRALDEILNEVYKAQKVLDIQNARAPHDPVVDTISFAALERRLGAKFNNSEIHQMYFHLHNEGYISSSNMYVPSTFRLTFKGFLFISEGKYWGRVWRNRITRIGKIANVLLTLLFGALLVYYTINPPHNTESKQPTTTGQLSKPKPNTLSIPPKEYTKDSVKPQMLPK